LVGTKIVIGKNTLAKYPKTVATLLQKNDPQLYTGHAWRRTSITLAANRGLSLVQLKNLSGHKSDTVVQGYINDSVPMKETTANAVSIDSGKLLSSPAVTTSSSGIKKRKRCEDTIILESEDEDEDEKENSVGNLLKKRGISVVFNLGK
jgi:hypothetical protein